MSKSILRKTTPQNVRTKETVQVTNTRRTVKFLGKNDVRNIAQNADEDDANVDIIREKLEYLLSMKLDLGVLDRFQNTRHYGPVSYTHLTLPTIYSV